MEVKPRPVYPMSGQITLGASGSVSQFPVLDAHRASLIAHPSNSGNIWIGNESGTVTADNGFPLSSTGVAVVLEGLGSLGVLYASPDVNGDKVCWILLDETPHYDDVS